MVGAFYALSLWAGIAGYLNFQLANSTDAGIITQAVASTAHGGVPPFFESVDCLVKNRCSFLIVHPAFLLYAEVPAFLAFPSTLTLFAIRAAIVALAAVPLYWLTRQLTGSDRWSLLAAGMYLVFAPTSTDDFSLHMESYLPLEIILLVALWQAGRYRWGLAVAVIAFATIEIAPVFTFLVGVFFLFPPFANLVRSSWHRWRDRASNSFSLRGEVGRWARSVREGVREASVRFSLILMSASVGAYVFLYSFMNVWGAHVLGIPSPTTGQGIGGLFYNNSTPAVASLTTILHSHQTLLTAEYWLVLFALLGFIPLLAPRTLILSVPWIGWTFLSDSSRFTTIGHQYSFIAAGPLFVGFAYGLDTLAKGPFAPRTPVSDPSTQSSPPRRWALPGTRGRSVALAGGVAALLAANMLFLPFNPLLPALGYQAPIPFESKYFDHTLTVSGGFEYAERMVASIPARATIAAPSALYPLIAAHWGAVALRGRAEGNTTLLPFNYTNGPDYALLYESVSPTLDAKDWGNLSNGSQYHIRAYVASTGIGTVFMLERGYQGTAQAYGPVLTSTPANWTPMRGLSAGPVGQAAASSASPSGSVIETSLTAHRSGLAWSSVPQLLPPGNYSFVFQLALTGVNGTVRPAAIVLNLVGTGFGAQLFDQNLTFDQLPESAWSTVILNATVASPVPAFQVEGYLRDPDCSIAVASVLVDVIDPGSS